MTNRRKATITLINLKKKIGEVQLSNAGVYLFADGKEKFYPHHIIGYITFRD